MPLSDFPVRPSVAVSDITRAAAFYEGVLGLPVLRVTPSAGVEAGGRVYGAGDGTTLNVFQSDTAGASRATLATWYVTDLDAVARELTDRGVELLRYDGLAHDRLGITARAGGGRIAWFADPDGGTYAVESDV